MAGLSLNELIISMKTQQGIQLEMDLTVAQ